MQIIKGIVIAAGLFCLLAFSPLVVHADLFQNQRIIAETSSIGRGPVIDIKAHVEEVTCETTETLNISQSKPDGDLPYLVGTPAGSRNAGFSISSFNRGPRVGLVSPGSSVSSTTQNPEPASMLLLGTGLAAIGAIARKRLRRPRK
jgi:hypothetical protein